MAKRFNLAAFLKKRITQEKLRKKLGYKNRSAICRKLSGQRPWSPKDARKLEKLFPGEITRAKVRPDIYDAR